MFSQKLIYRSTDEIKIILTLQEDSLQENKDELERVLEWLNVGDSVPIGVVLVITKATQTEEYVKELLRTKSKELHNNLANGAALFEHIVAKGCYTLFH